jgi:hypothetical protein
VRLPSFAVVLASSVASSVASAADHIDSPGVVEDPATDITDLYAWMNADGTKVELAMAIAAELFAPGIQYVFHVTSAPAFGGQAIETVVLCTFDPDQDVTCWAAGERVSGDAHDERGLASESGKLRVFTGLREDAFYFNAAGFSAVVSTVKSVAGALTFDPAGCPQLDAVTASTLAAGLGTDPFGGAAKDLFVGPVATIVVELDKSLLIPGGPIIGVWASARR